MIVLSDRKNFSAGRIALAIAVMRKKRALVNDARKESARLWKQYLNGYEKSGNGQIQLV